MKFGRNLPQFIVPEWSASYIKYKALKKLIKSAAEQIKAGEEADLAGKRCLVALTNSFVPYSRTSLTRMAGFFGPVRLYRFLLLS